MSGRWCALVVAKAPVPGRVKTRLCPPATPRQAAELAAAALLDTLEATLATPGAVPVVALAGQLTSAARHRELAALLRRCVVLTQRGPDFGARLVNAHADTARARPGLPVVQFGMDTPQVTPALLGLVASGLAEREAVVGEACDGGWWVLALRDPARARALAEVPMSRPDTAALTFRALAAEGLRVAGTEVLRDVDTMADALAVAELIPHSRFATALRAVHSEAASH